MKYAANSIVNEKVTSNEYELNLLYVFKFY